jgi:hypothetical protein
MPVINKKKKKKEHRKHFDGSGNRFLSCQNRPLLKSLHLHCSSHHIIKVLYDIFSFFANEFSPLPFCYPWNLQNWPAKFRRTEPAKQLWIGYELSGFASQPNSQELDWW